MVRNRYFTQTTDTSTGQEQLSRGRGNGGRWIGRSTGLKVYVTKEVTEELSKEMKINMKAIELENLNLRELPDDSNFPI